MTGPIASSPSGMAQLLRRTRIRSTSPATRRIGKTRAAGGTAGDDLPGDRAARPIRIERADGADVPVSSPASVSTTAQF